MKKKLVQNDLSTHMVWKEVVIGHFAMWAVHQSPYLLPNDIADGIEEFDKCLSSTIDDSDEKLIEATYTDRKKKYRKGNIKY